jgi:hypothetical protein
MHFQEKQSTLLWNALGQRSKLIVNVLSAAPSSYVDYGVFAEFVVFQRVFFRVLLC